MKNAAMFISVVAVLAIALVAFGSDIPDKPKDMSPVARGIGPGDEFRSPEGERGPVVLGGPDAFGYKNEVVPEMWYDADGAPWATMFPNWLSDSYSFGYPWGMEITIPSFWFYGNVYNEFSQACDGVGSFTYFGPVWYYWSNSIPAPGPTYSSYGSCDNLIALLWVDCRNYSSDPNPDGRVWYGQPDADHFVLELANWHNYYYGGVNFTCEFILWNGADATWATMDDEIYMTYHETFGTYEWFYYGSNSGIENWDGSIGLTYPPSSISDGTTVRYWYTPPPDNDAAAVSIIQPHECVLVSGGDPVQIVAEVKNAGLLTQSFDVEAAAYEATYAYPDPLMGPASLTGLVGPVWADTATTASLVWNQVQQLAFSKLFVPAGDQDYLIVVTTMLSGDEDPTNDSVDKPFKAPDMSELTHLAWHGWDYVSFYNGYYFYAYDWIMATEFEPPVYPALVRVVQSKTVLEGYTIPWPDAISDPCYLSVWNSLAFLPWLEVSGQSCCGINPPVSSWYYHVPVGDLIIDAEYFYHGFQNEPGGGEEGITVDQCSAPDRCWTRQSGGVWYEGCYYGDHIQEAYVLLPPPIEFCEEPFEYIYECPAPWTNEECFKIPVCIKANAEVEDVKLSVSGVFQPEDPDQPGWLDFLFFEPASIEMDPGDEATILGGICFPIGTPAGTYSGQLMVTSTLVLNGQVMTRSVDATITVTACCDLDVDDDYANLAANKMVLVATESKKSLISVTMGEFVVLNPNDNFTNVDMDDGPGNVDLTFTSSCEDLYAYKDDKKEIPGSNVTFTPDPGALASGEAMRVVLAVEIPDKVHKIKHDEDEKYTYRGTVTVTSDCGDEDDFTLNVKIVKGKAGMVLPNTFVGDLGERGLLLSWGEFSFGESFNLYRENESGEYILLNSNPMPGNSNYLDENIVEGGTYAYKFGIIDETGKETVVGPMTATITRRPTSVSLMPGVPNPMSSEATIRYTLSKSADVTLKVYDVTGSVVKTLVNESVEAGHHSVLWNGTNEAGNKVANGVYFYRLTSGDFNQSRKLVVLR